MGQIQPAGLHAPSVNEILTAATCLEGLSYAPSLSSHSLRRGMATSAHRAGAGFRDIKKQGGWRHDGTVHGYIEEADRFSENAAGALLKAAEQVKQAATPDSLACTECLLRMAPHAARREISANRLTKNRRK